MSQRDYRKEPASGVRVGEPEILGERCAYDRTPAAEESQP